MMGRFKSNGTILYEASLAASGLAQTITVAPLDQLTSRGERAALSATDTTLLRREMLCFCGKRVNRLQNLLIQESRRLEAATRPYQCPESLTVRF